MYWNILYTLLFRKLGLDLVPRVDGEQVDADKHSICQLYRVHENSAEIAKEDKVHYVIDVFGTI